MDTLLTEIIGSLLELREIAQKAGRSFCIKNITRPSEEGEPSPSAADGGSSA
jgi:hypothetical protein